jgi:hypothetical protein
MLSVSGIREHIERVLSGQEALDAFEEWLASESWNMHQSAPQSAQRLAFAVELRLAEHDAGHLSEEELYAQLKALLHESTFTDSLTHSDSGAPANYTLAIYPFPASSGSASAASAARAIKHGNLTTVS